MGLREPPPDVGEMDLLEQLQLGVEVVYDRPLAEAEGRRDIADARLGIPVSRHHFGEHPQDVVPRVIALPRRHQFRLKAARNAFRPRLPAMAVATGIAWWWTVSAGMSTSRGLSHAAPASAAGRLEPLIATSCSQAEPNSALRRLARVVSLFGRPRRIEVSVGTQDCRRRLDASDTLTCRACFLVGDHAGVGPRVARVEDRGA